MKADPAESLNAVSRKSQQFCFGPMNRLQISNF
jgi:hypothetical protein